MKDCFYRQAMETVVWHQFCAAFDSGCDRCTLSEHGCGPIIYRGNPKAPILLIGEAPGQEEEKHRKPFVGPAGELLDNIMKAIGLDIDKDMCITNSVFCRPTASKYEAKQNYTPKQTQIVRCWPFVEKAITILKPKIIIACGGTAMRQLMDDATAKVGQWEGRWTWYTRFGSDNQEMPMFTMTHPAAILHKAKWPKEQLEMKRKVWEYMQYFRDTYKDKIK